MANTNHPKEHVQAADSAPAWLREVQQQGLLDAQTRAWFQHLQRLSEDDLQSRAAEIARLLRTSGFAEDVTWDLDPLPLLIAEQEWQTLSRGIAQRLRLLAFILADLNQQQTLLKRKLISAGDLLQHPYYSREQQTMPVSEQGLFLVAMDLGRDASGRWQVLADHCQFPRGLGQLLENRIIARRVMGEEFTEVGVQRIANFFELVQQAVHASARGIADPRVVILTRGPDDTTYSEQAYLATYLGYTLVRSGDLTVRKGAVWLKSLDGLRRVDVILRWIEDQLLDSLEQNQYSELGIPGLLQAVRSRNVRLLNPFGCGLLQIPAIKHRLPEIATAAFGEELIFGEPGATAQAYVDESEWHHYRFFSHLDPKIQLDGQHDADRIRQLLAAAHSHASGHERASQYYFCRKLPLDSAPFWDHNRLLKRPFALRCYALIHDDQIHVLPGAMCSTTADTADLTSHKIKDTWIQTTSAQTPPEPLASLPKKARRALDMALVEGVIPSRTAENLYWLGCGTERCENTSRLLRLLIDNVSELVMHPDSNARLAVMRLTHGIQQQALIYPYQSPAQTQDDVHGVSHKQLLVDLLQSDTLAGSLFQSLQMVHSCAMQVRELLTYDSLRIVEDIETETKLLRQLTVATATHEVLSCIDRIIGLIMAFNGSTTDTMPASNGSFMLRLGRRTERMQQLTANLDFMLADDLQGADQQSILQVVLRSQVSSVTHKRRYRMFQSVDTALELLLLDPEYPRSLLFQVEDLMTICNHLPKKSHQHMSMAARVLFQLKSDCILVHREQLAQITEHKRHHLMALLQKVRQHISAFQEVLQTSYFSHTQSPRKLDWSQADQAAPTGGFDEV